MDFLCRQLGYEQKHKTDYGLWEDCEAGDKEALQKMYLYNQNDVYMLEDLYLRMRGWLQYQESPVYLFDVKLVAVVRDYYISLFYHLMQ